MRDASRVSLGLLGYGKPVNLPFHHNTQWRRVKSPTKTEVLLEREKSCWEAWKQQIPIARRETLMLSTQRKWLVERSEIQCFCSFLKGAISQESYKKILDLHQLLSGPSQSQCIKISNKGDINMCSELMFSWRIWIKREFFLRSALNNWIWGEVQRQWQYYENIMKSWTLSKLCGMLM